jgi:hypothetical protein
MGQLRQALRALQKQTNDNEINFQVEFHFRNILLSKITVKKPLARQESFSSRTISKGFETNGFL